ncbi:MULTISPECIES: hypothetical protein [Rhodococcus]|nr:MULTISPECIES: hypothetical protein [Rhodococcus]AXY49787.1 hypothetical protein YT1_0330 [Rhodococcus ruber]MCF8784570.1 hypothetical protein [Rhodococcus ruber]MCZ1075552.1 hypothetical protein [Rhodococcus sp. A5(2022)]
MDMVQRPSTAAVPRGSIMMVSNQDGGNLLVTTILRRSWTASARRKNAFAAARPDGQRTDAVDERSTPSREEF